MPVTCFYFHSMVMMLTGTIVRQKVTRASLGSYTARPKLTEPLELMRSTEAPFMSSRYGNFKNPYWTTGGHKLQNRFLDKTYHLNIETNTKGLRFLRSESFKN